MRATVSMDATSGAIMIRPSMRPRMARAAATTSSLLAWELEIRIW